LIAQGAQAATVADKLLAAQRKTVAGSRRAKEEAGLGGRVAEGAAVVGGSMGGIAGMIVGGEVIHAGVEALKAGATLEQMKVRVGALAPDNPQQAQFAEKLAQEVSAKFPAITQEKALDTFVELYANSTDQNGKLDEAKARRNMMVASQLQVAGAALNIPVEPHDVQNLVKAMEGTGQANDPNAVKKITDLYFRSKQVFGSALTSDMVRDLVANAKAANFSLDDRAFAQSVIRTTEGNASRLGNEISQTMNTLIGGHMQKQTALWLMSMGLATGFKPQGGGKVTLKGITGGDLLQTNQVDWANEVLLPHILAHAPQVSEKAVEDRIRMLRSAALKLDPSAQIDERALHERAEEGLYSTEIQKMGVRTTVADNLAHAIANQKLIERDLQAVLHTSSPEQAAGLIKENPVAAFTEFTNAFENLGAVVVSPAVKAIAPLLDELAHAMAGLSEAAARLQKEHPDWAIAGGVGTIVGGGLGAGAAFLGSLKWFGRLLGLGGGKAAAVGEAVSAAAGAAPSGGLPIMPWLPGATAVAALANAPTTEEGVAAQANAFNKWFDSTTIGKWLNSAAGGSEPTWTTSGSSGSGAASWPIQAGDLERSMRAEQEWRRDPEAAHGRAIHNLAAGQSAVVGVSGEARVDQTFHFDISLDPELRASLDKLKQIDFSVPMAPTGRMDSDAAPQRAAGTGHM
jgi:hypothetical protein